jgi:anti-sigma-K factor RskA
MSPDPHTLVGAYVLDAVDAADRAQFEEHLAGCETCQAEVRGLRETTARLGAAAAVQPRAGLREQTVRAAGRIRQLPPVTGGGTGAGAGHETGRGPGRETGHGTGGGRVRWSRPRVWVAAAAAAVAVLALGAAGGMGAAMHGAEHQLDMARSRSQDVAAVLAAPDATMLTAQVSSGGSATVVMSHRDGALVFSAAGLAGLGSERRYELWVMGPSGAPQPAGMLPPARHGMTGPMVVSGLAPGDKVGLTVEPASGSPRPTTPPILMLSLS